MGQQQLLLIVLGVIIVGIAIAVGISMFKSNAQSSNRDQVINDLNNLAAKAQQYYRKPTAMGGGGQDFNGFKLAPVDTGNANGSYSLSATAPTGTTFVPGDTSSGITSSAQTIYIVGCGKEKGNDGTNPVKAYATVTPDNVKTTVLN
jgi:Tfp pilus assembly protein PilE